MADNISIREFLKNWDDGVYKTDRNSMCKAGWYDWFCHDYELYPRLEKMVKHIKILVASPRIDQDKMYVWFKNNAGGRIYDDFRIKYLNPETEEDNINLYVISMVHGHKDYREKTYDPNPECYAGKLSFEKPVAVGWRDIYKFFGVTQKGNLIKPKKPKSFQSPPKEINRFAHLDMTDYDD